MKISKILNDLFMAHQSEALKLASSKHYLITILSIFTLFAIGCNSHSDSGFDGKWQSTDGYKLTIKKVTDKMYDVKVYSPNSKIADSKSSGAYTCDDSNSEIVTLRKEADNNDNANFSMGYVITYAEGQIHFGSMDTGKGSDYTRE